MRITFLTGGLEPGKDGVGDYTRLLAIECARLGAQCQVIAIADRQAGRPSTVRPAADVEIVRLPSHLSWHARLEAFERASRWFAPQWVSVQFVPFSFQRWGIATRLVAALPRLIEPARLHVMFHELWVGPDGSWRRWLISHAQRRSVLRLCRYPRTLVHTSNHTYQQRLAACGVTAGVLPLFGSVPMAPATAMSWLAPHLAAAGCGAAERREDWWLFLLFGTLHPIWPPEPLIERLEDAGRLAGKRIAVISAGRLGPGEALWQVMKGRYAPGLPMVRLGEQPDTRLAELFNTVDFGIATSPLALLGKSATAAAMLEHGLPVVVNREDVHAEGGDVIDPADAGWVIRVDAQFARNLAEVRRREPKLRRAAVAAELLGDLSAVFRSDRARGGMPEVA